ncbi:MAG: site-2 protease family protein [Patescibacteria group bacterium]
MYQIFSIIGFLLALTVHEFMHAWTANYLGDPTAKHAGRVSLNPIAHIDLFGTILLPLVLILSGSSIVFGWAKPVPINPNSFNNPRLGSALTAIAGPIANLVLAIILAAIYQIPGFKGTLWGQFLIASITINLVLMIFNLIPIPPLDGSKFFALFIPGLDNPKLDIYGPILLLAFILVGGTRVIWPIVTFFMNILGINVGYY